MNPDELLTLTQAADQCGVNRRQLERAARLGDIKTTKPGKKDRKRSKKPVGAPVKYYVRRGDLEIWLEQQAIPPDHVTVEVAAAQCKVGERLLYDAIKANEVPAYSRDRRFGLEPKLYVMIENVEAWRDRKGVRTYNRT